jgi:PadR family transcriptional regulator, regulatory protein AphA
MRSNRTKFAILGMLSERPLTGYDIRKKIQREIPHFWSESYGQIYPLLKRMVAERLLTRRHKNNFGKKQYVYMLTSEGEAAMAEWLGQPVNFEPPRDEFMLKFYLGYQTDGSSTSEHIMDLRERTESELRLLNRKAASLGHADATIDPMQRTLHLLSLEHSIRAARMTLQWCDEALAMLEDRKEQLTGRVEPSRADLRSPAV